jgi:nucleotide-binding universal stress UspA family protein
MASVILVLYDGRPEAQQVLESACDVAAASDCDVEVLHFKRVPLSLPLTNLPQWLTDEAEAVLDQAREIGASKGVALETHRRFTYDVGAAVVSEANRVQPQAIYLSVDWPHSNWFPRFLPRTVRDVMRNAHCPVYLGYFPNHFGVSPKEIVEEAERVLHQSR